MSIARINHTIKVSTDGSNVTTNNISTIGASLIVLIGVSYTSTTEPNPVDSSGNTWIPLTKQETPANSRLRAFYCSGPTTSATHNFGFSAATTFPALAVLVYSGTDLVHPFDLENGNFSLSSSAQGGSVTPTNSGSVVISATSSSYTGIPTVDSGLSVVDGDGAVGGLNWALATADLIETSPTAKNPSWTGSTDAGHNNVINAVFNAAATSTPVSKTVSDSYTLSDSVVVQLNVISIDGETVNDTLIFSDSITVALILPTVGIQLNDSFILTDGGVQTYIPGVLTFFDTLTLLDSDIVHAIVARLIFDNILLTDSVSTLTKSNPTYTDTLSLLDNVGLILGLSPLLTDTLSLSDSLSIKTAGSILEMSADTLVFTDSVNISLDLGLDQYIRHYLNDVVR